MGFFIFGVNHKDCPVAVREKIHFTSQMSERALSECVNERPIEELVILSTCNRVEFYGFAENAKDAEESLYALIEKLCGVKRSEFINYLYHYSGKDAVKHLFRVAAGLDSLVVGENEILGQIRAAFKRSIEMKTVHSFLYRLMEKTLKNGKDVRSQTKINEGAVSIPSVAVELAEKIFGDLSDEKVMVLGTGEMSALTIKNLRQSGAEVLYVVSRSREKGEAVAVEFGAEWLPLEDWEKHVKEVDILIASTAAPHTLVQLDQIKRAMNARHQKPLFLIDISVPRNIEASINTLDDVYLYNIDDLKGVSAANLKLRTREIKAAEAKVEEAVLSFQAWLEQLSARPILERYENFLNEVLDKDLSLLVKDSGLSEEKKNEIREKLRARLLHPPLQRIKEASRNGGVSRYVEALHSLFNLDKSE